MRHFIYCVAIAAILTSCVTRPFVPVNVGREYGNPTTPWVVSHMPEKNHWALALTKPHNVFQRILCFSYPCRKMIGRRKTLRAISFEKFKKEIAKNAKKGAYKDLQQRFPLQEKEKPKLDTVIQKKIIPVTPPKMAPVEKSALKADSLITLSDVLFETDSYRLKAEHYSQLDALSKFLLTHPSLEVSVTGHTDNRGTEKHNVNLSARRAEAVAQYLINNGVDDEKVFFEGLGSSKPIGSNDTEEGRSLNRRVEILIRDPNRK